MKGFSLWKCVCTFTLCASSDGGDIPAAFMKYIYEGTLYKPAKLNLKKIKP